MITKSYCLVIFSPDSSLPDSFRISGLSPLMFCPVVLPGCYMLCFANASELICQPGWLSREPRHSLEYSYFFRAFICSNTICSNALEVFSARQLAAPLAASAFKRSSDILHTDSATTRGASTSLGISLTLTLIFLAIVFAMLRVSTTTNPAC